MAKPSKEQVRAVRDVIYDRQRLRQLAADAGSIDVIMNINNPNEPDGAPVWTIAATGDPSSAVLEAIRRCRRIAAQLREMRDDLNGVDIPGEDRSSLRDGLKELAAVWDTTADVWEAPGSPEVETAVESIESHREQAGRALRGVRRYLKKAEDLPGEPA